MDTPFEIGRTYYLPKYSPTEKREPCPICYGAKVVTIILGNDERVTVECDGCGIGYESPRGFVNSSVWDAAVHPFTVESVTSMYGDDWYLKSKEGDTSNWKTLCETEAEALEESRHHIQKMIDENMRRSATSNKQKLKTKTWHVRYHEDCIRELERKIAWHRAKVSERKPTPEAPHA